MIVGVLRCDPRCSTGRVRTAIEKSDSEVSTAKACLAYAAVTPCRSSQYPSLNFMVAPRSGHGRTASLGPSTMSTRTTIWSRTLDSVTSRACSLRASTRRSTVLGSPFRHSSDGVCTNDDQENGHRRVPRGSGIPRSLPAAQTTTPAAATRRSCLGSRQARLRDAARRRLVQPLGERRPACTREAFKEIGFETDIQNALNDTGKYATLADQQLTKGCYGHAPRRPQRRRRTGDWTRPTPRASRSSPTTARSRVPTTMFPSTTSTSVSSRAR